MKNTAAYLLLAAFVMGCDASSNPFNSDDTSGDPTDPSTSTIPDVIAGDVTNVSFDSSTGTLTVTGATLDNVPVTTTYTRTPSLDQDGFLAYTTQDDPLDRHFTALVAEGTTVRAAAVSSPTPRNRTFLGAFFERDGSYDPPDVTTTTGLVSYVGSYAGVTNIPDPNPQNLLSTTVTPTELQPGQALIVDGDVFLNADFADNTVEGNIYNRRLLGSDGTEYFTLPSVVMIATAVEADGSFEGTVEYDITDPASATTSFVQVGDYAGLFGGTDASEVAGAVFLDQFDGSGNPLNINNELESGAFVLESCTAASTDPVCTQIP